MTPRGQRKAITLERCFDKQPWIYNRTHSAHFSGLGHGDTIKKDKDKNKIIKKKLRQQYKAMRQSSAS